MEFFYFNDQLSSNRFWHPNVYTDGRVCISILHTPDPLNPSEANHCWSPVQRVETILLSVISMLTDANISSPANVDASVEMRKDPEVCCRSLLMLLLLVWSVA